VISTILFVVAFSFLLNWCISLQILAQTEKENRTRIIAIAMSIVVGILIGLIALQ
jgi:hypothetical protein